MTRAAAAAIVGLALWLTGAVFAPSSAAGGWLVALPSWPALAAALAAAVLLVAWRPPSHFAALLPLVAVVLPWVPRIDAGLLYAGPLMALVWAAVLVLGWGSAIAGGIRSCPCAANARSATIAAFLIALASTSIIAWRIAPMVPGGDEPHYLIMTQSLLQDGDLRIENNHAQRDYAAYWAGDLPPQYLVRGDDGAIYPVHAPGLPALALPAFAAGGYTGVLCFLILVMALASALMWRIAWLATGDIGAAWFGWAIVAASCSWAFQSFLVFPDAFGAAAVACGLWLVLRLDGAASPEGLRHPSSIAIAGAGVALALLPWLHTRFAVLAGGLGLMIVMRLYRTGARQVAIFLAAPAIGAAAWFAFFYAIYGTPNPLAPWGGTGSSQLAWVPGGLAGLLFDQQFGLLPYAPALAAGFAGLAAGTAAGWTRATRLQLMLLLVVAYIGASASYAMWWAGHSVPARLFTVLLPVLAPAGAVVWMRAPGHAVRAALAAGLGWSIFATASLAFSERGAFAWNTRQHKAGLWFDWLSPLVKWTEALPAFFRAGDNLGRESLPLPIFYSVVLVWIAVIAAAVLASVLLSRAMRRRALSPVAIHAITITALVLALPAATVFALRLQGADGGAPSRAQLAFLTAVSGKSRVVIDLASRRRLPASGSLTTIRMSLPAVDGRADRSFGSIPAGRYRMTADPAGPEGSVIVGRGAPIATLADAPVDIAFPLDVNALVVRGAAGRAITLETAGMLPRRWRQKAARAFRYGPATAYFVDDRAYPEADAFWVGGSRFTHVVLQADPGVAGAVLEILNAPVPNRVIVIGAAAPFARDLAPAETVRVPITFDTNGAARLQIDSQRGFTPSAIDAANLDKRFLGVRVTVK